MHQIILLMFFFCTIYQASSLEFDVNEVYSKSVKLAYEHQCSPPHDFATVLVNCLNHFTNYSARMNLDDRSVCDFDHIAGPYDALSACIEKYSNTFNCHDRFMLFDNAFRNIVHPAIFSRCSKRETEKADWSPTFIAGTLAVLSSAMSAVASLLVYYFSSK